MLEKQKDASSESAYIREIQRRHKILKSRISGVTLSTGIVLDDALKNVIPPKKGERMYSLNLLEGDQKEAVERRKALAKYIVQQGWTNQIEPYLGFSYSKAQKDPSTQKHLRWTFFRKAEDLVYRTVERERSNITQAHLNETFRQIIPHIEEDMPYLTTEHIKETELKKVGEKLGIDLNDKATAEYRALVYQAAVQKLYNESPFSKRSKEKLNGISGLDKKVDEAFDQAA